MHFSLFRTHAPGSSLVSTELGYLTCYFCGRRYPRCVPAPTLESARRATGLEVDEVHEACPDCFCPQCGRLPPVNPDRSAHQIACPYMPCNMN